MTHCIIQTKPEGITKLWIECEATKRWPRTEFELSCLNRNTMFKFLKLKSD